MRHAAVVRTAVVHVAQTVAQAGPLHVEWCSQIVRIKVDAGCLSKKKRPVKRMPRVDAGRDEAVRSVATEDLRVRVAVALYVDHAACSERAQLRPCHEVTGRRRRRRLGNVDGRAHGSGLGDTAGDGERDGLETVPPQQRGCDDPEAGMGIVETQHHRSLARMHTTAHEAIQRLRGHGSIAVLGEVSELRLQRGHSYFVQVKDRQETADGPAEYEGGIPTRREIDHPSQQTAALGERYVSRRAHHAHLTTVTGPWATDGLARRRSDPRAQ